MSICFILISATWYFAYSNNDFALALLLNVAMLTGIVAEVILTLDVAPISLLILYSMSILISFYLIYITIKSIVNSCTVLEYNAE